MFTHLLTNDYLFIPKPWQVDREGLAQSCGWLLTELNVFLKLVLPLKGKPIETILNGNV